jgi:class 3 adenylate cyclase
VLRSICAGAYTTYLEFHTTHNNNALIYRTMGNCLRGQKTPQNVIVPTQTLHQQHKLPHENVKTTLHNNQIQPITDNLVTPDRIHVTSDVVEKLAPYLNQFILDNIVDTNGEVYKEPKLFSRQGAMLFIDISGFTTLTESLADDEAGAEILTKYVNAYFTQLVDVVFAHGGDIERWSGDAMICCWYTGNSLTENVRRSIQCGHEVQQSFGQFSVNDDVTLTLHCAIASGDLHSFDMGGYEGQWHRLTFGDPMDQLDTAVSSAGTGELVIAKKTFEQHTLSQYYSAKVTESGDYLLLNIDQYILRKPISTISLSDAMEPALRQYVDKYVQNKIDANQMRYMSEIKHSTIGFISMNNKNFYATEDIRLQAYNNAISVFQKSIAKREGCIINFLQDEKGAILVMAFGHPYQHSNDAYRAIKCMQECKQWLTEHQVNCGYGIASGKCFFGRIGSDSRCDFSVISDTANTAARLMKKSELLGGIHILVDETTAKAAAEDVVFEKLEAMQVKGKQHKIKVHQVIETEESNFYYSDSKHSVDLSNTRRRSSSFFKSMRPVGRSKEFNQIGDMINQVVHKFKSNRKSKDDSITKPPLIVVNGPTGLGKTHLVTRLLQKYDDGRVILFQTAKDIETSTPYFIFDSQIANIIIGLVMGPGEEFENFDWSKKNQYISNLPAETKQDSLKQGILESEYPYLSLLNSLFGTQFPSSPELESLSEMEQIDKSVDLIVMLEEYVWDDIFHYPDIAIVVMIFDNYQYCDIYSKKLINKLLVSSKFMRNGVIIATLGESLNSSDLETEMTEQLLKNADLVIDLEPFTIEETKQYSIQLAGSNCKDVHPDVVNKIYENTSGNPQVITLIVPLLIERGFLDVYVNTLHFARSNNSVDRFVIPTQVASMIQQRIDRLALQPNLLVKIAAILAKVGTTFTSWSLANIHPEANYNTEQKLEPLITILIKSKIIQVSNKPDAMYSLEGTGTVYEFVNSVAVNILYESVTRDLKVQIHERAADYYQRKLNLTVEKVDLTEAEKGTCSLIAFHLMKANENSKKENQTTMVSKEMRYQDIVLQYLEEPRDDYKCLLLLKRRLTLLTVLKDYYYETKRGEKWQITKAECHLKLVNLLRRIISFSSSEIIENALEAENLLPQNNPLRFEATFQIWWSYWMMNMEDKILEYADKVLAYAKTCGNPLYCVVACNAVCMSNYSIGEFKKVVQTAQFGMQLYQSNPEEYFNLTTNNFQKYDSGVTIALYGARAALMDGKLRTCKTMDDLAEQYALSRNHPRTIILFLLFSTYVAVFTGELSILKHKLSITNDYDDGSNLGSKLISQFYELYIQTMTLCNDTTEITEKFATELQDNIRLASECLEDMKRVTSPNIIVYWAYVELLLLRLYRVNLHQLDVIMITDEIMNVVNYAKTQNQKNLIAEFHRYEALMLIRKQELDPSSVSNQEIINCFVSAKDLSEKQKASFLLLRLYISWCKYDSSKVTELRNVYYTLDQEEIIEDNKDIQTARLLII